MYVFILWRVVCKDLSCVTALEQSTAPVQGVVSVHTGSGAWGTGVLVKDDIIVTCAHVIQQETGMLTLCI